MYLLEFLDGGLLQLSWWQLIVAALVLTHITIASVYHFPAPQPGASRARSSSRCGDVFQSVAMADYRHAD